MDNIRGIPTDILSKSFPGIHHGLFRFLFRADPIIRLRRIPGSGNKEIIQPDVEPLIGSHSHSAQNVHFIPLESEIKVEVTEPEDSGEETFKLNLGKSILEMEIKSESQPTQNIILEEVELKAEVKPELETRERFTSQSRKSSIERVQIKSEPKFPFGFPSIQETPLSLQETSKSKSTKYSFRQRKALSYADTIEIDMSDSGSDSDLSENASFGDDLSESEASEEESDEAVDSNQELSKAIDSKIEELKMRIKNKLNKGVEAPKSRSSVVKVIVQNSKKPEFNCDTCSKSFSSQAKLSQHKTSFHFDNPTRCPEKNCESIFMNSRCLKRHIREVHRSSPIICKHCPTSHQKQFKNPSLLNAHIRRSHRELKKYSIECTEADCNATFRTQAYLQRHLELHRDPQKAALSFSRIGLVQKKTTCPHCDKPLSIEQVKHHIARFHNPQRSKNVICESCGKAFFTANDLRRHSKVYHNPQMEGQVHKCPDCGRKYSKYNQYINHRKMRSCRPLHQCSHCSQKFPQPRQLREHENTHTKDVKYECEDCGSVFYTKNALRQHSLGHEKKNSNEKEVVHCPHCDLTFIKKGTLRYHIWHVHNLDRDFKCSFPNCSRTFIQEINLKKHEKCFWMRRIMKKVQMGNISVPGTCFNLSTHQLITNHSIIITNRISRNFLRFNLKFEN